MSHNRSDLQRDGAGHADAVQRGHGGRRWLYLVVDVLLLAAIVSAVFFLVVLLTPLNPFGGKDTEQKTVLYTLEITGVDRTSLESLHRGDSVLDAATGSKLGEVVSVDSRPYEFYTEIPTDQPDEHLNSHVVTKDTRDDAYTVTVTVRVEAEYRAGVGYTAEDCRIAVGRVYELHFPAYVGKGVCVTLGVE